MRVESLSNQEMRDINEGDACGGARRMQFRGSTVQPPSAAAESAAGKSGKTLMRDIFNSIDGDACGGARGRNRFRRSCVQPPCAAAEMENIIHNDNSPANMTHANTGKLASERLHFAPRRLINVVLSFAPLAFLCNDAQFADSASINLLKSWLTDLRNPSLVVIWTCRSDMVGPDHFVTKAVDKILAVKKDRHVSVLNLQTRNMHQVDVNKMIADLVGVSTEEMEELAETLSRKTAGNVFFVSQF